MANLNNPHGCRPLGISLSGGPQLFEHFLKVVGYGTAIFRYDAVNRVADGSIEVSITPGTTNISGVSMNYGAASTATEHEVLVSPDALFEAQGDDGTGFAAADEGLNCNLILTAGNATTKQSKHQLDASTVNTTNTLDVKVLKLFDDGINVAGGYARVEFLFNKHRMTPVIAGV